MKIYYIIIIILIYKIYNIYFPISIGFTTIVLLVITTDTDV